MAATLIAATSERAAALPWVSISHDGLEREQSRLVDLHAAAGDPLATTPWSASGPPNASRSTARRHIIDMARSANPIARIA